MLTDLEQQADTASLGMWLFLGSEVLFFGGLFLAYAVYRISYPEIFQEAGKNLNLTIGTINTAILLISSYFMALAVHAAKTDRSRRAVVFLALTLGLGTAFLGLKAYEYADDIAQRIFPNSSMMDFIYYVMTGVHALHLTIGLGAVLVILVRTRRGDFSSDYYAPIEVTGLYWHFVDVIWIFLYPLLYLMDRHL
jgi:cytochrome c oxidase subunit 3